MIKLGINSDPCCEEELKLSGNRLKMARLALLTIGLAVICISYVDSWNYPWHSNNIGSNQEGNIGGNDNTDEIGSSDGIGIDDNSQQLNRLIEVSENLYNTIQTIQNYEQTFNPFIQPRIDTPSTRTTITYKLGQRVTGE